MERPGSLFICVAGNVFEMGVFEVVALAMKSLMLGIYITVQKANCQLLTLRDAGLMPLKERGEEERLDRKSLRL